MADLVVDRYEQAITAAANGDRRQAEQIINGDEEINQLYLELEGHCTELIALQQPVASDLRVIAASFKIITDLERIADLATNLADYTRADHEGIHPAVDIKTVGGDAAEMVTAAMTAYEETDADACRAIAERDDKLDAACEETNEAIIHTLLTDATIDDDSAKTAAITDASRGFLTVRDIERVGDHAVNIAARTLYMIDNDDELLY